MRTEKALEHFGTTRAGLARVLGLTPQAVNKWRGIIPLDKAALLTKRSSGALWIDWECYDERGKPKGGV